MSIENEGKAIESFPGPPSQSDANSFHRRINIEAAQMVQSELSQPSETVSGKSSSRAPYQPPPLRKSLSGIIDRPIFEKPHKRNPSDSPMWHNSSLHEKAIDAIFEVEQIFRHFDNKKRLERVVRSSQPIPVFRKHVAPPLNVVFPHLALPLKNPEITDKKIRADSREILKDGKRIERLIVECGRSKTKIEKLKKQVSKLNALDNTISSSVDQIANDLSQLSSEPTIVDKLTYFQLSECVSPQERAFRAKVKSLGITLIRADDIKAEFGKLDTNSDGLLDLGEYAKLAAFIKYGRGKPLPEWELGALWSNVPKHGSTDSVDLDGVLAWVSKGI